MKKLCLVVASCLFLLPLDLRAASPMIITEFMASNTRTLGDEDNHLPASPSYPDWIEIQNVSTNVVNLGGWFLTDSAKNLTKWSFPPTNLPPGRLMVVFASGKNRRVPGAPLHTSFKLGATGGYLALVEPDGSTIATEFAPTYPPQISDVSYGFGRVQTNFTLVPSNTPVRAFVPADDSLSNAWTFPNFDDRGWINGLNGVGYDAGALNPAEDLVTSLVLNSGPIGYWRFEETSGTTATNLGSLGTVANGTYLGGPTLGQPGPRPSTYPGFPGDNSAAAFNGSTSRVQVPDNPAFDFGTGPFSLMIWFNPVNPAVRGDLFTYKSGTLDFDIRLAGQAANTISVYHNGFIGNGGNVQSNQWYCFVLTRDSSGRCTGYLNGSAIFTNTDLASMTIAQDLLIGCNYSGTPSTPTAVFNGLIDEVALWSRTLSTAEVSLQYQTAATTVSYSSFIGTDVSLPMFGNSSSCYVRYLFNLDDPSMVGGLTLRLKYDDGFVAYLNGDLVALRNAPADVSWNSPATTYNPDGVALAGQDFNISSVIGALQIGTNVLAIQGLNTSATNSDFLIYAELTATSVDRYTTPPRYFTIPTPGTLNNVGTTDLGPIISGVGRSPAPPAAITTNDSITVTARVEMAFAPVTNVMLYWRVMWGTTNALPMFDDGLHGDGAAGDHIFGATIPAGVATSGQMLRWFILAYDSAGRLSRWPVFANPAGDAEYEGTMIADPAAVSSLQIWHFFIDPNSTNKTGIETESGGRGSMFYAGEFYDNIYLEVRGNTTAGYPKKSHRLEFNSDHPLKNAWPGVEISRTSLLSETADPAYLRTHLSFWLLDLMGVPSPFDYPVHCRLNGQFWGLWFHNDVMGPEQLQRLGYDPLGALYKAAGQVTPSEASTGGFEKKTRLWENHSDYQALAIGISETQSMALRKTFIFDNLNLPEIVNYLAVARWTQEGDDVWANMTLYRDTLGTREWFIIPFDLNVSWGQLYCGDSSSFNVVIATNDNTKSHPLYGGSQVLPTVGGANWNRIYDAIIAVPETRQMLLRRERTLLEQFIQPPGTSFSQGLIEQHIAYMTNLMWAEMFLDRARNGWPCPGICVLGMYCWGEVWPTNTVFGAPGVISQFIVPRRTHFWATHCLTNTAKPVGLGNNFNAGIPPTQPDNLWISIRSLDADPVSHNQHEEYVCLTNSMPMPLDLSGWQLDGAVNYTFKPGTVMPSNSALYVSPDLNAFRARAASPHGGMGLFVVGPYQGQLSARGETVRVLNLYGRVISSYTYAGNPSLAQQYLRITELMYNPPPLPGNTNSAQEFEFVKFKNISTNVTLNLTGVQFTNGIAFTFTDSAVTNLLPGQTVLIVKNLAAFTARYGSGFNIAGQYDGYLNNGGERLQLLDAADEEVLDFSYNNNWYPITDGLGFSLVVVNEWAQPDAWNSKSNWRPSGQLSGAPGGDDPGVPALAPILVNEALTREDAPPWTDAIELFNPTATNVDIGGWFLSDDFFTPKKYRIPDATVIGTGGYRVFMAADFDSQPGVAPSFGLGSDGDHVYLFSADAATNLTGYAHGFNFGAADNLVSFGRYVTSDGQEHFVAQVALTLGTNNAGPRVGPVVINELMYHPPDAGTNDNTGDEFIEFLNINPNVVALFDPVAPTNTWLVTGGVDYAFPTNVTLAPGEFALLVNFGPTNAALLAAFQAKYAVPTNVQIFGPYGGKLNNNGDNVELKKPVLLQVTNVAYVLVDKVNYHDSAPWPAGADGFGLSLQRLDPAAFGDDPINWVADLPTAAGATQTNGTAPVINVQPQSQNAIAGQPVTLSVSAGGSAPLNYQWRVNGANVPGATNFLLQLPTVQTWQGGDYQVLVYNAAGSAVSTTATVSVSYPASILTQPQSQTVYPLNNVTFSVVAFSSTPMTFQWRLNNVAIPGATNGAYSIASVQPSHAGDYTVAVTDSVGPMVSAVAQLTVIAHPVFTLQPTNRIIVVGAGVSNATFAAAATSTTPVTFQWYFNGTNSIAGATNASFTITNVQPNNAGTYTVVATDNYGSISSQPAILVLAMVPTIVQNPLSQSVVAGGSVTLSVTVTNNATLPVGYRWRLNSVYLPNAYFVLNDRTCFFTVTNVQAPNTNYTVVVTNAARPSGFLSTAVLLTILPDSDGDGIPDAWKLTYGLNPTNAADDFLDIDGDGMLNWQEYVAGTDPTNPASYLRIDLLSLSNVSQLSFPAMSNHTYSVEFKETPGRGRWYRLTNFPARPDNRIVTFLDSLPTTNQRSYRVGTPWQAETYAGPVILTAPQSASVSVHDRAFFSVVALSSGPLNCQWNFNDAPIAGATTPSLELTNVAVSSAGKYTVRLADTRGADTSDPVWLTVTPLIVEQPQDLSVSAGQMAIFRVVAVGADPLQYQWYRDARPLAGETNASLILQGVRVSAAASYSVTVRHLTPTGPASIHSRSAELRVNQ